MSRWAPNTETATPNTEPEIQRLWRVLVTWVELVDGRRETFTRQRWYATFEEAQAKTRELQALIAAGEWAPTIAARDIEVDEPDQVIGSAR